MITMSSQTLLQTANSNILRNGVNQRISQLQERRAPTPTEVGIEEKQRAAKNVAQNLVYSLTGNPNESAAGTKYLSSSTGLPFTKTKEGFVMRSMTVGTFTKQNPAGTFFILVKGHAFTIKDGVVIGNKEDAKKLKRVILNSFEIK